MTTVAPNNRALMGKYCILKQWSPEKLIKNFIYVWIHGDMEYQNYVAGLDSLQPNPVKKIKTFFVKKRACEFIECL